MPFESSTLDPREVVFIEKATVPARALASGVGEDAPLSAEPPLMASWHTLTFAVKVTLLPADCGFWLDVRAVIEQVSEDSKLNLATKAVPNVVLGAVV